MSQYLINVEDFVHQYFQKPILKTIGSTPDIEHMFNDVKTKRDRTRCNKYITKINVEYLKLYNKQINKYESTKNILNHLINNYPYEIAKLFIDSIQISMEEHIRLISRYHQLSDKIKTFFTAHTTTESYYLKTSITSAIQYPSRLNSYFSINSILINKNNNYEGIKDTILTLKDKFSEKDIYFINSKTDEEWYNFLKNLKEYNEVKKYWGMTYGKNNSDMFKMFVDKIDTICKNINKIIGGYPDGVETDVHWGVDNVFNGIIYRNPTVENGTKIRASFKSFYAGGYNIQCRHIRVRVTILK